MLSRIDVADAPVNGRDELAPPRFPEIGKADGDDQERFDTLPGE